jgi:hypothetical protein
VAEKRLDQFSQDFFDAWDLAKEGKLDITFPTRKGAVNFRHRLYSFRSKLRKQFAPAPTDYDSLELNIEGSDELGWKLNTKLSHWREQIRLLKAAVSGSAGERNG